MERNSSGKNNEGKLLRLYPTLAAMFRENHCAILEEDSSTEFEDCLVVLECNSTLFRVTSDRGQVAIEFKKREGDSWHDAGYAVEFLSGTYPKSLVECIGEYLPFLFEILESQAHWDLFIEFEMKKKKDIARRFS